MSSELHMMCNYNKCKKPLLTRAWITSCSHAFCHEDGTREFSQGENKCPACNTVLSQKYDIVEVELNPSEEFKSMVLAGMRIETIFEICNRAVTFWNYQISQQCMFHAMTVKRARETIGEMETMHETAVGKMTADLKRLRNKMREMMDEEKTLKQRIADLNQQLSLKSQQIQKLQSKNAVLKQRYVSGSMSDYVEEERGRHHHPHHHHRAQYQPPQTSRPSYSMEPRTITGSDHTEESCSQQAASLNFLNTSHRKPKPTSTAATGTDFHFEPDIPHFDIMPSMFRSSMRPSELKSKSKS